MPDPQDRSAPPDPHRAAEAIGALARAIRHDLVNATFAGRSLCARLREGDGNLERDIEGFEMLVQWLEQMQAALEPLVERADEDPVPTDLADWWRGAGQLVARLLPFGSETSVELPSGGAWLADARRLTRALTLLVLRARRRNRPCVLRVELAAGGGDAAMLRLRLMGAGGIGEDELGPEAALLAAACAAPASAILLDADPDDEIVSLGVPLRADA